MVLLAVIAVRIVIVVGGGSTERNPGRLPDLRVEQIQRKPAVAHQVAQRNSAAQDQAVITPVTYWEAPQTQVARPAPRAVPANYPELNGPGPTVDPMAMPQRVPDLPTTPTPSIRQDYALPIIVPGHTLSRSNGPASQNQPAVDDGPQVHIYPRKRSNESDPPETTVPGQPPIHIFPLDSSRRAAASEPMDTASDGRPLSILPRHRKPAQPPQPSQIQITPRSVPSGQPKPFGFSSQSSDSQTLYLPPDAPVPDVGTPSPVMSTPPAFSSNVDQRLQPEVFAPPAFHGERANSMPSTNSLPSLSPGYSVPENYSAANVVVPGESSDLLSWWESDIMRPILKGRQPMPMTLEQALGLAISEAPELQVLHSDWFIRQVEIARQDAAFNWTSFVEGVWNRDSVPVNSSLDGATNRLRSRTSSARAGMRRLFRDGGEFEVSQVVGTQNSNSQFISPNNQGTSRLQFEWTHRLLRGGGQAYNSSQLRIAAIENDSAFDRFQEGVQDHLLNVASSYWILVLRRGRFMQSVTSWNRAKAVADEMARRANVDVSPAMLDRARSEVATRLGTTMEAQHDVYRAQDALLRLIYGAEFVQYAQSEVVTKTLPMKEASPVSANTQIERAIRNRSEVHRSIRNIKIASVQYEVAEDEVLPILDMTLTGYTAGLRGNNDVGGSIFNQFSQGEPGVGIGFNFEIPYRNRAALAAAEQARVAIRRMQAELETTIADVSEDVRDQVTQRNKYGAVLRPQWETLGRSRRLLKTTQVRRQYLADGAQVADLYLENLLQTQRRLEQAESTYLQSQIRFAVADNALMRAVSIIDTLASQTQNSAGPAAAVRESEGNRSSHYIDPSQDPFLSGYSPMNLDAVYEPPQPPIAR